MANQKALRHVQQGNRIDFKALQSRAAGSGGNDQVKVTQWETTYANGQLQSFAQVDPTDPKQIIFNLIAGVLSADQSTIYTAGWAIPEIGGEQIATPGTGLVNLVYSDLYTPSMGTTVTAALTGVVGTPGNEQWFSFTKVVILG
jgi:hypothetical protein